MAASGPRAPRRHVIFNADDFGASTGINRGIVECHRRGVVTSTSLMVDGGAAREAAALAQDHPGLAVGLHFDVVGEDDRNFDLDDTAAVGTEFRRQLGRFVDLIGRAPTHIDSHKHTHRRPHLFPLFREWVAPLKVPLRDDGRVKYVGGFYAQWEWKVTDLDYVSVAFLVKILREEAAPGWTEFSCHPGYMTPDFTSVYGAEREAEIHTLTDPKVRATIDALGYVLVSYAHFAAEPAR
ncbi:MAG: ChbG/HpnK family deacetylase [Alphaproteobacteria bacterium]|nr:ChbG/HpnK family deacetylase [Alphaproteobacteria bacterium]